MIRIRGARTHNLRNLDLDLPRNALVVVTGLSGSGKSSLAFDTLYAEGQRRYVESLSSYARQFLEVMDKPDVDSIEGLSPAIAIEQKAASHNPRSTVGTVTEIYDYLRLLYARAGVPRCPDHGIDLTAQTVSQMVDQVMRLPEGAPALLLAPVVTDRKGEHAEQFAELRGRGFVRARIDGVVRELEDDLQLDPRRRHSIEAVVDRFRVRPDGSSRLAESFETALRLANGIARVALVDGSVPELLFSSRHACPVCGYSVATLEPKLFSFNNPAGACPTCDGLGSQTFFDPERVVLHPQLSLAGGAIRGWDRRNIPFFEMIQALARHYRFDVETPWSELAPDIRAVVLGGSGSTAIRFPDTSTPDAPPRRGSPRARVAKVGGLATRPKVSGPRHPFEGILPNLERRWRETESPAVREELSRYRSHRPCPDCGGTRLNAAARSVFVGGESLPALAHRSITRAREFLRGLELEGWRGEVARKIVKEVGDRLTFLVDVGLDYLTLDRSAETLSGGEAQRIRLASQVGSGLTGVMYILDEPSIGLHQRDNRRLLGTLRHLRDLGNTVIVVEHDAEAILAADHVLDLGPGAGIHGGAIVAAGTPAEVMADPTSLTGGYLSGRIAIPVPVRRVRRDPDRVLRIVGARGNNLQNVTVEIPLGLLTCVTGVSGSGKSTLVNDTLYRHAVAALERVTAPADAGALERIEGLEHIDRVIDIDQSPLGRTPRSNPATYTGLFAPLRELYAAVPEARARGYDAGRFSFNVKGGRCEACEGAGVRRVAMHFLPDVYVACDVCGGRRYNRETLEIRWRGRSIDEALGLDIEEALRFFQAVPAIATRLQTLLDVGLGYVRLGQSATTLSGGEAQRVKLARELAKRATGRTLYLLDEPTTGLHFHDVAQLLPVLERLRDAGNTIVVIEHNLEVIKTADWVIDLGPEGGDGGGRIIAAGTPETVAATAGSHTGEYLAAVLGGPDEPTGPGTQRGAARESNDWRTSPS
jgi:excinuclease ABC subunit A